MPQNPLAIKFLHRKIVGADPESSLTHKYSHSQEAAIYMESWPLPAVRDSIHDIGWSTYDEIDLQLSWVSFQWFWFPFLQKAQ